MAANQREEISRDRKYSKLRLAVQLLAFISLIAKIKKHTNRMKPFQLRVSIQISYYSSNFKYQICLKIISLNILLKANNCLTVSFNGLHCNCHFHSSLGD